MVADPLKHTDGGLLYSWFKHTDGILRLHIMNKSQTCCSNLRLLNYHLMYVSLLKLLNLLGFYHISSVRMQRVVSQKTQLFRRAKKRFSLFSNFGSNQTAP